MSSAAAVFFPDDSHDVWARARNCPVQSLPDQLLQERPARVRVPLHDVNARSEHSEFIEHRTSDASKDVTEINAMPSERVTRNPDALRTEVEARLERALSETVQQYQVPAKALAPRIGTSVATVESLRQRIPQAWVTLILMGRALPGFGLEVMDAMNIDIDGDRAAFAKFLELQRVVRGK